jgi:hypothetical protein
MFAFLIQLGIFIFSTIAAELLRPKPRVQNAQASSLSQFAIPTADETRTIPILFGTCLVSGANVLWYGDLSTVPITQKVKSGLFGSTTQIVGYRYYLTMQYGLCFGPIDDIESIHFDGKRCPVTTSMIGETKRFSIVQPTLFGGDSREGGIVGSFDLHFGTRTQVADSWLEAKANGGNPLPAYRGLAYVVARGVNFGNSAYLKAIAFETRRCPNPLGIPNGHHNIAGDANPAAMIYEILTDKSWAIGLDTALVDTASFLACAETLFLEGQGLSMLVENTTSAWDLIHEIGRHVDAIVYRSSVTGLMTMKLVRTDYVIGALPHFNESNSRLIQYQRSADGEFVNEVRASYVDRSLGYTERIAQVHDLAGIQRTGETISENVDCKGFSTPSNAQRFAARSLVVVALNPANYELELDREGWNVDPGTVIAYSNAKLGLSRVPVRLGKGSKGTLKAGRIRATGIDDVFGISWTLTPPGSSGWSDPLDIPGVLAAQRLLELPYKLVDDGTGIAHRRVMTLGAHGTGIALGYQVWSDPTGGTAYAQTNDVTQITPTGTLAGNIGTTEFEITFGSAIDPFSLSSISAEDLALGRNLVLIDDEICAWQNLLDNGDGTFTLTNVRRGCIDTVPAPHFTGARLWFITEGSGLTDVADYATDVTVQAKLLPYNILGVLPIASATPTSLATASRALRPYPPTAVLVNDQTYTYPFVSLGIHDPLTVKWSHRNRLAPWSYIDAGATGYPESSYRIELYGQGGIVTGLPDRTVTGFTGTSYTWSTETSDAPAGGGLNTSVRVKIWATNAFGQSAQHLELDIIR